MNISFSEISMPRSGCLVLTMMEGKKLGPTAVQVDKKMKGALRRAIKASDFKGKKGSFVDILAPSGLAASRVLLAGLGKPEALKTTALETIGGDLVGRLTTAGEKTAALAFDPLGLDKVADADAAAHIALGAKLRSYKFDKYHTKKAKLDPAPSKLTKLTLMSEEVTAARRSYGPMAKVAEGMFLARDLVNEPANILYPAEFAARAKELTKLGVKVEILGEKAMEKLGMGSLLGVGQGSDCESQLVVMRWEGAAKSKKPVAFIGKGVCFDTGGISLKPAGGMEDMKGDMGGAACVTGLMHALAARKAKVNAIGILGLTENMPGPNAQRPGDIVTSMSGQTIEVINTDAEGRLVLADALWYTQDRFKPQFMIDLATLTGAIMVALGKEYAGLFSNNDTLAERITEAGQAENEKVWRLPMGEAYDKMINSKFADMKNVGGRDGGSITAAQFLERFVNKTPWAHIDVAGTAMAAPQTSTNRSWGSGFGVRLLNKLVADHYED